jgi:urease gamma subunit
MSKENEQLNDDGTKKEPELRQDDVSNDMTRTILARNNVKTDSQEVIVKEGEKKEDESSTVSAKADKDKQESKQEQTVTLTEDDIVALETAGIDEQSLDGKTITEVKAIAQDVIKEQAVKDEASQDLGIVSEEDALKVGGFAGNLIGKTPAELLEIINQQNSHIGKQSEQLSKPPEQRESVTSLNQQNLDTEDANDNTANDAVDLLHLTPEEQAKKLAEIIDKRVEAGIAKGLEKISPELDSVREQSRKTHMKEFHTALGTQLPEGMQTPEQAEKAFAGWKEAVKDQYTVDEFKALARTPNVLITLISTYYQLNNKVAPVVKKEDGTTTKEVKGKEKKSYTVMRDMLKTAPSGEDKFNFKRKAIEDNESDLLSESGSESQKMIGRIIERNLPK